MSQQSECVALKEPPKSLASTSRVQGVTKAINYKQLGAIGEKLALNHLKESSYKILDTNWRCRVGEIDIVEYDQTIKSHVLVEVKTRRTQPNNSGDIIPEAAVDQQKIKKYKTLTDYYMAVHPEVTSIRFDVISLALLGKNRVKLRHYIGAYWWDE